MFINAMITATTIQIAMMISSSETKPKNANVDAKNAAHSVPYRKRLSETCHTFSSSVLIAVLRYLSKVLFSMSTLPLRIPFL